MDKYNMTDKKAIYAILVILLVLSGFSIGVTAQSQETQTINTISVAENGDATWIIEIRKPLTDETSESDFQAYVDQVQSSNNTQATEQFRSDFSGVIQGASNSLDRDMQLKSLSLNATIANTATGDYGVTTVQFTWTNYASQYSDGSLALGQVLSDGYTLSETERLRIVPPEGYQVDNKPSSATINSDNSIEWTGPYAFSDLQFRFADQASQNDHGDIPLIPILGGFGLLIAVIISGIYIYRKISDDNTEDKSQQSSEDLQTEEEKLVSLIEENGGRIKQKIVSDEFDWSAAKVSRVAGSLEEEDVIDKLTIGRENVLDLNDDKN